ncbi:MAG: phage major capsid protein, P2 family [Fluviibacter sp.]
MRNETRVVYNQYLSDVAQLNSVASAIEKFTVAPSVQQTLETRIQESSAFLNSINVMGVTEQQGSKLGLSVGSPIASTTNTANADRNPVDPTDLDDNGYICTQTNFDTALPYSKLDAWAKFPDFQTRVRDAILKRMALDIIMIGFNGESRAATSNRTNNPQLQDVNIGWLQKMRNHAAQRVMDGGATAGEIIIGANGDFKNLDALVMDMVNSLIDPWHRDDTGLVALIGRDLLADKYFPIVNQVQANTEAVAADLIISQKRVGGLPAVQVPFIPAGTIMVTRLDNLSRYYQEGSRRRSVVDNAKRDRIENYESSNDAYVIEDYGMAAVAENIELAA